MANLLFYVADSTPAGIGGIDEYTKLMLHMDGDQSDIKHEIMHVNGSPIYSAAQSKFNGSSLYLADADRVEMTNTQLMDFGTSNFTIEWWMYVPSSADSSTHRALVGQYSAQAGAFEIYTLAGEDDYDIAMNLWYSSWGDYQLRSDDQYSTDAWHHVAIVRESSTSIVLYVDGVEQDAITVPSDLQVNNHNSFGLRIGDEGQLAPRGHGFIGYLEEFRVSYIARWTEDFSASLPTEHYTNDEDTEFLWHMDVGDVTGNHSVSTAGNPSIRTTITKWNGAMYFDGSGDYLTVPDHADWDLGSGDFTVDFWVEVPALISTSEVLMFHQAAVWGSGGANQGWAIIYDQPSDYIAFRAVNAAGTVSYVRMDNIITLNEFQHIAVVGESGGNVVMYLNGVAQTTTDDWDGSGNNSEPLQIGMAEGSLTYFTGYIDELRISKGIARWTTDFDVPEGPYTT